LALNLDDSPRLHADNNLLHNCYGIANGWLPRAASLSRALIRNFRPIRFASAS
jgi:hypothetical protein